MDEKLLHDIEDMQAKLDRMIQKRPYSLHNIYFLTGGFFFVLFILALTQSSLLFKTIALVSFLLSATAFFRIVADIFYYKKNKTFALFLGVGILSMLGLGYYALWSSILSQYTFIIYLYAIFVIILSSAWYLLHALIGYLRNYGAHESLVTAMFIGISLVFLALAYVHSNMITQLLLIISTLIAIKAVYDFSQHFVRRR